MDKYDVMRYALNNNNKLPRAKPERVRAAAQAATSGPSKEVSAARAARAANVIKAGKVISTGARIARASNMLSNALQAADVGVGSDKPKGSGGNVLGATKQETAGRMNDVASRRTSVPMSAPRADLGKVKKTAGSPHPSSVTSGRTTTVPMSPPRADMGRSKPAGSGKKLTAFGAAFSTARKAGKKTFTFNGKSYTTKVKK